MEMTNTNKELAKKGVITYNGVEYAMMEVDSQIIAPEEFQGAENLMLKLVDYELWKVIKNEFDEPKGEEETDIDNSIYYYCDSGFIDSNPTIEELKKYFAEI